jgi:hypothetical protein
MDRAIDKSQKMTENNKRNLYSQLAGIFDHYIGETDFL